MKDKKRVLTPIMAASMFIVSVSSTDRLCTVLFPFFSPKLQWAGGLRTLTYPPKHNTSQTSPAILELCGDRFQTGPGMCGGMMECCVI
jgi:hypothetical protein